MNGTEVRPGDRVAFARPTGRAPRMATIAVGRVVQFLPWCDGGPEALFQIEAEDTLQLSERRFGHVLWLGRGE